MTIITIDLDGTARAYSSDPEDVVIFTSTGLAAISVRHIPTHHLSKLPDCFIGFAAHIADVRIEKSKESTE